MEKSLNFEERIDIDAMRKEAYAAIKDSSISADERANIRLEYIDRRKELMDNRLNMLSEKIDSGDFTDEDKAYLKDLMKEDVEETHKEVVLSTPRI